MQVWLLFKPLNTPILKVWSRTKQPGWIRKHKNQQPSPSPRSAGQLSPAVLLRWRGKSSAPASHDDPRLWHGLVNGFMRQDTGAVQVKFVVHDHILPQHRHILHSNLQKHGAQSTMGNPARNKAGLGGKIHKQRSASRTRWYSPTDPQRSSSPRCSSPTTSVTEPAILSARCSALSSPRPPQPHQPRW